MANLRPWTKAPLTLADLSAGTPLLSKKLADNTDASVTLGDVRDFIRNAISTEYLKLDNGASSVTLTATAMNLNGRFNAANGFYAEKSVGGASEYCLLTSKWLSTGYDESDGTIHGLKIFNDPTKSYHPHLQIVSDNPETLFISANVVQANCDIKINNSTSIADYISNDLTRFNTNFATKNTDNLAESATKKYLTLTNLTYLIGTKDAGNGFAGLDSNGLIPSVKLSLISNIIGFKDANSGFIGRDSSGNATIPGTFTLSRVSLPQSHSNRKIMVYPVTAGNDFENISIGTQPDEMTFHVHYTGAKYGFYAATSGTADQLLFRINGDKTAQCYGTFTAPLLSTGNTESNKKITLYDALNNLHQFYGLGVNAFVMRYQVEATSASHKFYAGLTSTTSQELFSINGDKTAVCQGAFTAGLATSAPTLSADNTYQLWSNSGVLTARHRVTSTTINDIPLTGGGSSQVTTGTSAFGQALGGTGVILTGQDAFIIGTTTGSQYYLKGTTGGNVVCGGSFQSTNSLIGPSSLLSKSDVAGVGAYLGLKCSTSGVGLKQWSLESLYSGGIALRAYTDNYVDYVNAFIISRTADGSGNPSITDIAFEATGNFTLSNTDSARKTTTSTWTVTSDSRVKNITSKRNEEDSLAIFTDPEFSVFNYELKKEYREKKGLKASPSLGIDALVMKRLCPLSVGKSGEKIKDLIKNPEKQIEEPDVLDFNAHYLMMESFNAIRALAKKVSDLEKKVIH